MSKITITPEQVGRVQELLDQNDGTIWLWKSVNLNNLGMWWLTAPGSSKPNWQAGLPPTSITADDIEVTQYEEFKRVKIALRRSSSGLYAKLTDHSSDKVHRALEQAGEGSVYHFEGMYAIINRPSSTKPLKEFIYA